MGQRCFWQRPCDETTIKLCDTILEKYAAGQLETSAFGDTAHSAISRKLLIKSARERETGRPAHERSV